MDIEITTIISDVLTTMDEIQPNEADFEGTADSEDLSTIIESKIEEACDYIQMNADISLLAKDNLSIIHAETQTSSRYYSTTIDNMLRFVYAKCTGWSKTLTSLITEDSPEYLIATDKYVGATIDRPAAILGNEYELEDYTATITLMPQADNPTIAYIERCNINTDQTISIDSNLYKPFVNYLAGLTLLIQKDDLGDNLIALAKNEIGMTNQQ